MRTNASPGTTLGAYPIIEETTTRVSDVDGYGHLNAIRIGQLYEEARASFYTKALANRSDDTRILVAELTFQYLAEGFWPGKVKVGTGIAKLNNTSLLMGQGLFQDDKLLGLCKTVLVCTRKGRSTPLPEDLRAAFLKQMIKPEAV